MGKTRLIFCLILVCSVPALATESAVAIHVSELTQALETRVATPPTPAGSGTTGYEWWTPWWRYAVMAESLKEALRSDGTPFVVVTDADISAGALLMVDGTPRYPIVISLASEAVRDDEIGPLRDFVAAGGFLFVGSSAFTRRPDGTSRGDFALAAEMGLHMASASLENWGEENTIAKGLDHRLVSHIPSGDLEWEMPLTSEDISWGTSPAHTRLYYHHIWRTSGSGATVIASNHYPYIAAKSYGRGQFIYHAAMQPLIGNGGHAPGMYAYGIFRKAIEWAFESANIPLVKISPWPYPYNAAYLVRHDFESYWWTISHVEDSAQEESTVGARGDYYFCTGALREGMQNSPAVVDGLRRAVSLYGATIGSHNGGLRSPNNPGLVMGDDDYWHWGPDEALDTSPPGYASGRDYARASIAQSFADLDGWLAGLGVSTRTWVAPYFNATRDASYDVLDELGAITSGEQKISPFPHWVVSTKTPGRRFRFIALPVSDWFISSKVRHATDDGHSSSTIAALIDYYYDLGALVNLYSHDLSTGGLPYDYLHGCAAKPAIWATNAAGVFGWWTKRSTMQIASSHAIVGNRLTATMTVSGAVDPDAAIELVIPDWTLAASDIQVRLNGSLADPASFRVYHDGLKIRVGTSVSTVEVSYPATGLAAVDDAYSMAQGATLIVAAPGVLGNDSGGGTSGLSAVLVSSPSHGTLDLRSDGSLTYVPTASFSGTDSFTYRATDGSLFSDIAAVTFTVLSPITLNSLSVSPSSVQGGIAATGTVTLSGPAPVSGAVVALTSSSPAAAQVPASVTVGAGATSATFTVTTNPVASTTSATISGTYNGTTRTAVLTITAVPPPQLSLSLNPSAVTGGSPSTGTVTLSAPAPSGGAVVALTSSNTAAAQVPASVTVAAGATSATFTATTVTVTISTPVTITALYSGVSQTAVLTVLAAGGSILFSDDFTGLAGSDPQWTTALGTWNAAAGVMNGSSPLSSYGFACAGGNWTDYSVQARVQLPAAAYGGGIGGRVNLATGAHYGVWIYPEGTVGGTGVVRVVKFRTWTTYSGTPMAQASLPGVGTGWHTVKASFEGSRIRVFYDGSQFIDVTDNGFDSRPAYGTGAISLDLWTRTTAYLLSIDDVLAVAASAASLSAVSLSPTSVLGGNPSTGTVTLDGAAPSGGAIVALTSSNTAAAQVPTSVTVAAGATSATFTATTSPVASTTSVTISGTYNSMTRNATLTVTAPVASLSAVSLSPTSVLGGNPSTGTVTLDGAAPSGGAIVALTSSNTAAAQVPTSVTVAAGATSATFTATTSPVASTTSVTISATYNSMLRNATLTVTAPAASLSAVSLSPTSVLGGNPSTGAVTLDGAAPSGGAVVALTSSNAAAAQVPASVTVAAGATSATFTATTSPVASTTSVTISATYNSMLRNATLTVTAPVASLSAVSLSPTSVLGGNPSTGTVTLDGAAPSGGAIVALTSSNAAAAQVPTSVTVTAGATSATFTVTTSPVASNTSVTISGIYNGVTRTRALTVTAAALSSITLSPTSVLGGASSVGTATMTGSAPAGGAVVTLTSSNTAVAQVPPSVTVAAGATSATFTVMTNPVASNTSVTISGIYKAVTRTRGLTVTAAALTSVSLNPSTVLGGDPSTGTVTLSGAAPAGGAIITLSSNNAAAQVPASVIVPAGTTTATFVVTTSAVGTTRSVRISAVYRGTTRRANLTVSAPSTSP